MKGWSSSEPGNMGFVPEKRLLAAVLQRAVSDFVTGDGECKESAKQWLLSDETTDAPLNFRYVCEALDLDVDLLRAQIVQMSESNTTISGELSI
jgi:hypothetical protein